MNRSELFKYYPESWYPICLSKELKKGNSREFHAFGGKIILFRNLKGEVGIIKRYCPHMGTDLLRAPIGNHGPKCPFHFREFDPNGRCVYVEKSDTIPSNAHTKALTTKEDMGIVFVFFGDKPTFDFPYFSRVKDQDDKAYSKPAVFDLNTPYQALLFNGFDTHHLDCIHNRTIGRAPAFTNPNRHLLTADYSMKVLPNRLYDKLVRLINTKENEVFLECYGGNFLVITLKDTKDNILISSVPIDDKRSRIFLTSTSTPERTFLKRIGQKFRQKLTTYLGVEFLKPDIDIIENMKPEYRGLYSEQDIGVIEFWKYWDKLPRNPEFQEKFVI